MSDPQHMPPTRARAGVKLGAMRYVLGIGIAAVIIAFVIAYIAS
jgi:hypothetical protein